MNKVMLKVVDLHTYFSTRLGVVKTIDGVSFYVQEGETLGLVGESGSGKTVTSLSVLRLVEKPDGKIVGGKISFDGKDLLELSEEEMRSYRGKIISMILQDPMVLLLLLSLLYFFRRAGASLLVSTTLCLHFVPFSLTSNKVTVYSLNLIKKTLCC